MSDNDDDGNDHGDDDDDHHHQVCAGFEPRHRVRAAVEAKVLGQADGEGQRLVSKDARLVPR